MRDFILESIFLDSSYWKDGIEHGVDKHISNYILDQFADPKFRADLCMEIGIGNYEIAPPHTGYRKKDDGSERMFLVNEAQDRIILSVIHKWLMRNESNMIHPACKSYQSGIGIGKIVKNVSHRILSLSRSFDNKIIGRKFDIHKYFESIGREKIHDAFSKVELDFGESSVIDLLRKYYDSDIFYDSREKCIKDSYQGIKQGCAVSAWLANVILYPLDELLSNRNGLYVRYSDDILYIGEDYEEVTEILATHLSDYGLSLNEKKMTDICSSDHFTFLGYDIYRKDITLSKKWVKKFQYEIDRRTIKDTRIIKRVRKLRIEKNDKNEKLLQDILHRTANRVAHYLYYGNGKYSWATEVLSTVNNNQDLMQLSNYCLDALRAVYTGKTQIGGLGKSLKCSIHRGRGKNVKSNREATSSLIQSDNKLTCFLSLLTAQKLKSNKWLFRTVSFDLINNKQYQKYGTSKSIDDKVSTREIMVLELESLYKEYLYSQPTGDKIERFYALSLDDMIPPQLMMGKNRKECLNRLETYLKREVDFDILVDNPDFWYWQSDQYPEFVLLRNWFH